MMDIPVLIISFNNHRYVENTIKQLKSLNPTKMSNIIIMDNNSSDIDTINFLNNTSLIIQFSGTGISDAGDLDFEIEVSMQLTTTF